MQASAPQAPQRHPITVQEFFRMGETGVLAPDARIELIEGELIDMPPIGPPHASRIAQLNELLVEATRGRAAVWPQNPILLGDLSAPQPDIALLKRRDDFYAHGHPQPEDVLLLGEVADSSLAFDRDRKLPLYARFGIPEVWLVNIPGRTVIVHRNPRPEQGSYATQFPLEPPGLIRPVLLPDIELDLSPLL
ncbi:Uma2 family endonuclease [Thiohalocapsa sp. ML1]|jgi:Uma2 family endonuclease|uniref:Uma2 family endonuclease n=1 Tax=Thiohalocapsa sp. ML1 TaxID=1431688 RepID=UPI000731EEEC|nr:Uma2 family endonuclease [Thiohalocapsa sp. ML1]